MPGTVRGASTWARRLGALVVAVALAIPSTAFSSFGPSKNEVEKLYVEGQDRAEAKDYTGAADSWTRLLNILQESPDNQAIRESVMINVLEAHMNAYNLLVDEAGKKDVGHLRKGKATLDEYYANFKTVHGDRVAISPAIQQKASELESMLSKADSEAKTAPPDPKIDPDGDPRPGPDPDPKVVVLEPEKNGNGLIIGGSVVIAVGIGALVMIPVGVVRVNRAEDDFNAAQRILDTDPDNVQAAQDRSLAEFQGKQGQAIWIAGAVLAPLLLAGGIVMLVYGIKARQRYNAQAVAPQRRSARLTPAVGRSFTGLQLSGRF